MSSLHKSEKLGFQQFSKIAVVSLILLSDFQLMTTYIKCQLLLIPQDDILRAACHF